MKQCNIIIFGLLAANLWITPKAHAHGGDRPVVVASKNFTEAVILGDVVTQLLLSKGIKAEHRRSLGGSPILWKALLAGEIDVYGDYTGTILQETLEQVHLGGDANLAEILQSYGIGISKQLGFNNTYIIGMRADTAARLGIKRISDLAKHPDLALGFCSEFVDRADGWPMLQRRYGLPQHKISSMEHQITYRALAAGDIAATNLYSTDAEIKAYNLVGLEDDLKVFPPYEAVFLYRLDTAKATPGLLRALDQLGGKIDVGTMIGMNASVKDPHLGESEVAAGFLATIGVRQVSHKDNFLAHTLAPLQQLLRNAARHMALVFLPLLADIVVAVPLGIFVARRPRFAQWMLGMVGVAQTIPSLALLVFLIPLLGVGYPPAMAALFIYGMLPIMKNTCLGVAGVPAALRESADALSLSPMQRLFSLELPLASPAILGGIKVAAILNVGTATLGAIIGAGGFGEPILTGVRHDDMAMLLQGAIPAAVLALFVQWLFGVLERRLIPVGLRQ